MLEGRNGRDQYGVTDDDLAGLRKQLAESLPTELPRVGVIKARDFEVECPHCGHIAEGWVRDPRGQADKCDQCGTEYLVPGDVMISFA
jgi:hypothetical protein